MTGSGVRGSIALLLCSAFAAAQARAPFAGIVRDAAGAPIAGARVVCSWQSDTLTLGDDDRHEAVAGTDGAFSLELFVGHPYCVWAIGPAGDDGARPVAAPCYDAVGGRTLDLVCAQRLAPQKLHVTGTAPWLNAGPLALRLLVARECPVGPDVPIPGDGPIPLPPLPTELVTACLVDGRGQQLDQVQVDLVARREWHVAEPHALDVVAEDEQGRPVAGARILQSCFAPTALTEPLTQRTGGRRLRTVATTGADGKARALVAQHPGLMLLFATTDDAVSGCSGWFKESVLEDGTTTGDDELSALRFVMHPVDTTTVEVLGRAADHHVRVGMRGSLSFRAQNAGGAAQVHTDAVATSATTFGARLPRGGVAARVDLHDARPLPSRVVAYSYGPDTELPPIDLGTLRTVAVEVVDDAGDPVPFAHLGATEQFEGFPVYWSATLVSDARGRAELRLPARAFGIYATTANGHGFARVADQGEDPVKVRLDAFRTARLRLVDRDGRPVPDARLVLDQGAGVSSSETMLRLAQWGRADVFTPLPRSDAQGRCTIRFPAEFDGEVTFQVLTGTAKHGPFPLRATDEPQVLTLRN